MRPAHALDLKPSRRKASGVESHQALSSGAKKSPTRAISRKANSVPEQRVTFKNKVSGKNLVGTFIQVVNHCLFPAQNASAVLLVQVH